MNVATQMLLFNNFRRSSFSHVSSKPLPSVVGFGLKLTIICIMWYLCWIWIRDIGLDFICVALILFSIFMTIVFILELGGL